MKNIDKTPIGNTSKQSQKDPVMQAFRNKQKARLQRATFSDAAPPIFPDPNDELISADESIRAGKTSKEEMFPSLRAISALTKGLSKEQVDIWKRAMGSPSKATGEWRPPSAARKLALRIVADSILYEEDQKRRRSDTETSLVKKPLIGGRPVAHIRTLKSGSGFTGSDSYRPPSAHATLIRTQPHRFIEKMSSLISAWRSTKTGKGRQVVKNLAVAPRRGRQARMRFLKAQAEKNPVTKK